MAGNTKFVIDASYALALLLPDEHKSQVQDKFLQFTEGEIEFISTQLLPFEVLNGLFIAAKRKRIDSALSYKLVEDFLNLRIPLIILDFTQVWKIADYHSITAYDAGYVQLARSLTIPLLTMDKKLEKITMKK